MRPFLHRLCAHGLAIVGLVLMSLLPRIAASREDGAPFPQWQLDRMLAPIALYPDALLSQILMAATYPIEVVEAARWSRRNPDLRGDEAVWAVEREDWDTAVKSLVAFPQLLETMDERLEWTHDLGDAFLDQREDVMDAVQALRRRAWATGTLRSDERVRYLDLGDAIAIEPAVPGVVYVPCYDPLIVYGGWWWPSYPPARWGPWRGYVVPVAGVQSFHWNTGTRLSIGIFFGRFDWPRHQVEIVHVNNYYSRTILVERREEVAPRRSTAPAPMTVAVARDWSHDPFHRRGVGYRSPESVGTFSGLSQERVRETRRIDAMERRPTTASDPREPRVRAAEHFDAASHRQPTIEGPPPSGTTRQRSEQRDSPSVPAAPFNALEHGPRGISNHGSIAPRPTGSPETRRPQSDPDPRTAGDRRPGTERDRERTDRTLLVPRPVSPPVASRPATDRDSGATPRPLRRESSNDGKGDGRRAVAAVGDDQAKRTVEAARPESRNADGARMR